MKHNICAEYKHVRIRPLEEKDIELLRKWRNNKALSEFLRPMNEITVDMQKRWFASYLQDENNVTFAIEEIRDLNRVVGSVSLYDFKGDTAEVGKIVVGDPEAKGKKIGYYALLLAMYVGYQELGIRDYFGEVHEENNAARINDMRIGFLVTGKHPFVSGGYELEMHLPKEHFEKTHDFLSDIKIYRQVEGKE